MSTDVNNHAHDPAHVHDQAGHGSMRDYVIGFVLSVILTVIPFWLVMGDVLESRVWTVALIMLFGAVQIIVHMVYFLHMNRKSEGGWVLMSLVFTVIVIVIALVGSLWVMHHLNSNMMPVSPEQMRIAP
ncbi:cytochrome o ubiquinol oxidase subunit IV [Luteimonas sp. BDR2-5]|uniref:cytochrome o ubiquinol oxidase subunit IV n=1 Tax=Proluteimonas luteida TaxID=2878685 RepID=UPI001E6116ED|nr:cytochrome o ubiquinol oxidase subunit IV [Luteimonas sp. BDR2-5]MCD9029618.1 cytochrome o ubiquinol oxidase subunit IV [Luteimonas sp. BDR2-5]